MSNICDILAWNAKKYMEMRKKELKNKAKKGRMGSIKVQMEVNIGRLATIVNLQCKDDNKYPEDIQMNKLNTNFKTITNYLIQLFYKTDKKYSCTQTKIGKMLSILAFKYAQKDKLLFNENIYKYSPDCGTFIKDLVFIPNDIYFRDIEFDNPDNSKYISDIFNEKAEIPECYLNIEILPVEIESEIEMLFRKYGAYSSRKLAELLNPIVDKIVDDNSDLILLEKLAIIEKKEFNVDDTNNLIEYIFEPLN